MPSPEGGTTMFPADMGIISKVCEDALAEVGLIVTPSGVSTAGQVKLVDSDGEQPYGVAIEDTIDERYWASEGAIGSSTGETDKRVSIQRHGRVKVRLADDNSAIVEGDPIYAVVDGNSNEGRADIFSGYKTGTYADGTDLLAARKQLLGWACEAADANAGATAATYYLEVELDLHGFGVV
jgi:hypothetical protein